MRRRRDVPPALAPLSALAWLRYRARLLRRPRFDDATLRVARIGRSAAWWCAVALMTLTGWVVRWTQKTPTTAPTERESTGELVAEPATTLTPSGIRVRDKRKVRPAPASPPEAASPQDATVVRAMHAVLRPWWAVLGRLLLLSERRSLPSGLAAGSLGRQVGTDALRRLVVRDRHSDAIDVEAVLALAADDQHGDWRLPVAFWMRNHLPAAARATLVTRDLAASTAQPRGRLSVLLRIAAATTDALPDADARALLGTALALARRDIDPYTYSGDVVLARALVVRLLVERPELDDQLLATIALQAGLASTPAAGPIELRLLALAVRERAPDAGAALATAGAAAQVTPEQLEAHAKRADRPLRRPPTVRRLKRPRAPFARIWRISAFVAPWLWPLAVTAGVAAASDRLGWTIRPKDVGIEETVAALALVATVNVFTVQLSAQRLPGVVARYAAQPASLHASYSAALVALALAVAPPTRTFATARSWAPVVALGVFVVTFLFALLRFQQQSDAARAAAAHVRAVLPRARAAGRRFGRLQARAAGMKDALDGVASVTTSADEVHGEWRALLLARRRGLLAPRRRDLRTLLTSAPFSHGMRLRLFVGLGVVVRDGAHLGALVPAVKQAVDRRTIRRAHRRLRIVSADDVEDVQRATIALVELALRLAGEGDVGTAERVCRSAVRLVDEHIAAVRAARRGGHRRELARAGVSAAGLRSEALETQAARRLDDDQLAPVVPALRSALLLGARAQLQPEQHGFEVGGNLLGPLLDATLEGDGAVAYLPFAVPRSQVSDARALELAELLRAVGVRSVELGAAMPYALVLDELDGLAARGGNCAAVAVRTTSALVATTARIDAQLAGSALPHVVRQAAHTSQPDVARRRGLWRVGAAALAAGTLSVAVRVARLVQEHGDTTALRQDAEAREVVTQEAFHASLTGGYLGDRDRDALANYGRFLETLAPVLAATTAQPAPPP